MLNEIFCNILDECLKFDKQKFFAQAVKSKDAPNYYDVIKNPICLQDMKNKTKRTEYSSQQELLEDFKQLKANAEHYNGYENYISDCARQILAFAQEKLLAVENDIKNLEMLVQEKKEYKRI